jgi:hypothetical protein
MLTVQAFFMLARLHTPSSVRERERERGREREKERVLTGALAPFSYLV